MLFLDGLLYVCVCACVCVHVCVRACMRCNIGDEIMNKLFSSIVVIGAIVLGHGEQF